MRTTLDLPDPLMRELKLAAVGAGKSLKTLLRELIERGMRSPSTPELEQGQAWVLPILPRLQLSGAAPSPIVSLSNAELAQLELDDDIAKLKRIGFLA